MGRARRHDALPARRVRSIHGHAPTPARSPVRAHVIATAIPLRRRAAKWTTGPRRHRTAIDELDSWGHHNHRDPYATVPNESKMFYRRMEYPPVFSSSAGTRTWELHRKGRTSLRRGRLLHQSGLNHDRPTASSRRPDLLSAPNPLEVTRPGIRSHTAIYSGLQHKVIRLDTGLTLHFLPAGRKYARARSHERALTVTYIALARNL